MSRFISMLRGLNVSGQKPVKMEALRQLYESLGCDRVQTYLQSGNVVFESSEEEASELGLRIHEGIERRSVSMFLSIFLGTENDLQAVVKNDPFAARDPSKLHVTFLSAKPSSVPLLEIGRAKGGAEDFSV